MPRILRFGPPTTQESTQTDSEGQLEHRIHPKPGVAQHRDTASKPLVGPRSSLYDRDDIAQLFGHDNNPSWRTGHRDVAVDGEPHTILMVNLRKPKNTPLEHRYADKFLSADEFQWESQASTTQRGAKGQRILKQLLQKRAIHLFVRYHTKDASGHGERFTYCGALQTLRHEGEKPIRVWFRLDTPLPERLYRAWAGG